LGNEQPTKNRDLLGHLFCGIEVVVHGMPLQKFLDLATRLVAQP